MNATLDRPHYPVRGAPLAINTGLSVTVSGHIVRLNRDERRKRATVVVELLSKRLPTEVEMEAVSVAAKLLAARARRFLRAEWEVTEWEND